MSLPNRSAVFALGTASIDPSIYDQGDGFYHAVFNETTGVMDVSFPPMAELDSSTAIAPIDKRSTHDLAKRATTCSGRFSSDTPALDRANIQLAKDAVQRTYNYIDWGWVSIPFLPSSLSSILIAVE
jgi:hypothetical protein